MPAGQSTTADNLCEEGYHCNHADVQDMKPYHTTVKIVEQGRSHTTPTPPHTGKTPRALSLTREETHEATQERGEQRAEEVAKLCRDFLMGARRATVLSILMKAVGAMEVKTHMFNACEYSGRCAAVGNNAIAATSKCAAHSSCLSQSTCNTAR